MKSMWTRRWVLAAVLLVMGADAGRTVDEHMGRLG
jgi:hypothetical protein